VVFHTLEVTEIALQITIAVYKVAKFFCSYMKPIFKMKHSPKYIALATCALMLTSTTANADFFPSRQILSVPSDFEPGSSAQEFRSFLSEEGFAIFEKRDERWQRLNGDWGIGNPSISRQLNSLGCDDPDCRFFLAKERRVPPIFSSFYVHSYNFGWIEKNGQIFAIIDKHHLWVGNK